jgi:hypothetical protein
MSDKIREQFEAWASKDTTLDLTRRGEGYDVTTTNAAWRDYQAAMQSPEKTEPALVEISEYGEGQENDCPACGAEAGSSCSSEEGVEYGRRVHEVRQS